MPDYGNGGVNINGTNAMINAYTGATTASTAMSVEMKEWYNTEALENARAKYVFGQFAAHEKLPANTGRTVEWRKPNTFADVGRLQEGVIPKGKKFGYSAVRAEVYEYGDYAAVTEMLKVHAIDPVVEDLTMELSEAGAKTMDKLYRDELLLGTVCLYAPNVAASGTTANSARSTIDNTAKLTPDLCAEVAAELAAVDAPKWDDGSVAVGIIHPDVAYDLMKDGSWIDVHKYKDPENIYNGEIGSLYGIRFVQSTNAKVFKAKNLAGATTNLAVNGAITDASDEVTFDGGTVEEDELVGRKVTIGDTACTILRNTATKLWIDKKITATDNAVIAPEGGGASGVAVYACEFLTPGAYAIIDPEEGGMRIIAKNKGEIGGPLEQFSTVGIWFKTGCKILYNERIVRVECGSSRGSKAVGN